MMRDQDERCISQSRQQGGTIMKRTDGMLDAKQVLSVVEQFTVALDLLDDYDHQRISKPKGNNSTYVLT